MFSYSSHTKPSGPIASKLVYMPDVYLDCGVCEIVSVDRERKELGSSKFF